MKIATLVLILPLITLGCGPSGNSAADDAAMAPVAETTTIVGDSGAISPESTTNADNGAATDPGDWTGRWNGPEGLFLDIRASPDGKPGRFALTLKDNLDSQQDYDGMVADRTIQFQRNGKEETIHPGTGAETGFKDLIAKKDCLIVQQGKEGYCR